MGRQKAISILIVLALIVAAVAGLTLLPKQYTVGQRLSQTTAFWNDREAFLFLAVNTTGRSKALHEAGITKDSVGTGRNLARWLRSQRRACNQAQLRLIKILPQMTLRTTKRMKVPDSSLRRNAKSSKTRAGTISL